MIRQNYGVALLLLSSAVTVQAQPEPAYGVDNYQYGQTQIKELRRNNQVERVEVRPKSGPGYTLRDKDRFSFKNESAPESDFPSFSIYKW